MSSRPIPSALDARTQAFPVLTAAQISRVRSGSKVRHVDKGEILFKPGDMDVPFFVLLSGSMEIVQPGKGGAPDLRVVTHHARAFTGEITMISGQRCLVLGRDVEAGKVQEVTPEWVRTVVAYDAELSEI